MLRILSITCSLLVGLLHVSGAQPSGGGAYRDDVTMPEGVVGQRITSVVETINSGKADKVGEWMTPDHVFIDSDGTGTNGREPMVEIMERLEML